ncbi:hypothetical protein QYF61_004156 [Mycteria americana]|uniref:Uncharacterized protein n=1 Tax=Mycteria americana TaxID=33587 RepID=A0AAN7NKU2_MYCAM|nr:hypothetical protein QYF61_004156 [Mycteria americana]
MVVFLGCKRTLSAHVQLFISQYPQVLLHRAALNPFIPQPILIPGVALTQVQNPHEVHRGPLLELVQVPLDGILSLRRVNRTTQLGVVCKLAEGALDPTVCVIDEDIKQYWSLYRPLRDNENTDTLTQERLAYLKNYHTAPNLAHLALARHSFQSFHQLCCPPLDVYEYLHILLKLWGPALHTVFKGTLPTPIEPAVSQHHRSLSAGLLASHSSPNLHLCPALLCPRCRIRHFDLLNFIPFIIAQCSNLSRSLCKSSCPSKESTAPPSLVSSSTLLMVHSTPASRWWINILNRTGPRIEP